MSQHIHSTGIVRGDIVEDALLFQLYGNFFKQGFQTGTIKTPKFLVIPNTNAEESALFKTQEAARGANKPAALVPDAPFTVHQKNGG